VVEVKPDQAAAFQDCLGGDVLLTRIGQTCKDQRLRIAVGGGEWIVWVSLGDLKEAWQKPLRW
jgi:hypothetical protein